MCLRNIEVEAMELLNQAVTSATQRSYSQVEDQWLVFLSLRFPSVNPWLDGISQREKRIVLVNFMKYTSAGNHSVSKMMGGLRHVFRTRLYDLTIFDDGVVKGARKALKPRGREVSIRTEQRMRAPFTLEMLKWSRSQYWAGGVLEDQMTYLGASLQYALVWRVSELISNDHGLHIEDVIFITYSHQHVLAPQLFLHSTDSIQLVHITSRSSKTRGSRGKLEFVGRDDSDSLQLLLDLICWVQLSAIKEGDYFLSRNAHGRNKRLTRSMITGLVKVSAKHFGLPIHRYSTHSLRIGGPTEMLAAGASPADILLASGHQSDAGLLYQLNSTRARKPFQVVGGKNVGLSSEETFNMLPRTQSLGCKDNLVLRIPSKYFPHTKTLEPPDNVLSEESVSSCSSDSE